MKLYFNLNLEQEGKVSERCVLKGLSGLDFRNSTALGPLF